MATPATEVKKLTPEEKQKLLLAGVGPVQEELGWPHFTKLTGEMLRKLVDAGAVSLEVQRAEDTEEEDGLPVAPDWDEPVFRNGQDKEKLAFLEQYPKFMAQGRIGSCGVGTIDIDTLVSQTKLTKKEVIAFANLFGRADEFYVSDECFRIGNQDQTLYFACAWFD